MIPTEWLGHRRAADGELVGYLVPETDGSFTPVTVLGLPVPGAERMDLDDAERCLEEIGLGPLAERWLLAVPEHADPVTVAIVEATPAAVTVVSVGLGDGADGADGPEYGTRFTLDVPVTADLRRA